MFKKYMSFEAESNSELTVIVPAYQLHFRFPLQNKIHKQKILSDTRTGILGSIAGPCDFLPARSDGLTNFKKSGCNLMVSLLASNAVEHSTSPGRVKPKTRKLVFVASPLNTQL